MSERTLDETMSRYEFRSIFWGVTALDLKTFVLERRVRNLERQWPGEGKVEQHEFRMERMRVRHELELLKIEMGTLEQRASRWNAEETG